MILPIPPIGTSAPLRVSYLLLLSSMLPDAFSAYAFPLDPKEEDEVWHTLQSWDNAWYLVLNGFPAPPAGPASGSALNSSSSAPIPPTPASVPSKDTGVRPTDRVRLQSVILDVKDTIRAALGLPSTASDRVKLTEADGAQYVVPTGRADVSTLSLGGVDSGPGIETETDYSETATTPDLVRTDDGTSTSEAITTADEEDDGDSISDDDEDEDVEFEEVASPSSHTGLPELEDVHLPPTSFSIHFSAPLPPPPEAVAQPQSRPSVVRKGFDPDAEYGMDDEDEGEDGSGQGPEDERDAVALEKRIEEVFRETIKIIDSLHTS
ncbi:hypothetical protein T439DRAFT_322801 [Meredithblackwellia eburnea MCA 4105]